MSKVAPTLSVGPDACSAALGFLQTEYANADGFISVAAISLAGPITVKTMNTDNIAAQLQQQV